jgi:type IV secretion system protein VirB5
MPQETRSKDPLYRDDRIRLLARSQSRAFYINSGLILVTAVAIGFGVWASQSQRYVPFVMPIGEFGRGEPVMGLKAGSIPREIVRRELGDFVVNWRSVSIDAALMESNLRRANWFFDDGTPAATAFTRWYNAEDTAPFERAKTELVSVKIETVLFLGGRTWSVEWTETIKDVSLGRTIEVQKFKASFVVEEVLPRGKEFVANNPLGLLIRDWDIEVL